MEVSQDRSSFALTSVAVDDGHLVTVAGEVDIATAPALGECLVRFSDGDVTVDLSAVDFIDSSGLNALVTSHNQIERRGSRLVLRGTSSVTQRLLEITGLDEVLNLDGQATDVASAAD